MGPKSDFPTQVANRFPPHKKQTISKTNKNQYYKRHAKYMYTETHLSERTMHANYIINTKLRVVGVVLGWGLSFSVMSLHSLHYTLLCI